MQSVAETFDEVCIVKHRGSRNHATASGGFPSESGKIIESKNTKSPFSLFLFCDFVFLFFVTRLKFSSQEAMKISLGVTTPHQASCTSYFSYKRSRRRDRAFASLSQSTVELWCWDLRSSQYPLLESKHPAFFFLAPLVIIPQKMEEAMDEKELYLFCKRVANGACLPPRLRNGNHDISF